MTNVVTGTVAKNLSMQAHFLMHTLVFFIVQDLKKVCNLFYLKWKLLCLLINSFHWHHQSLLLWNGH